MVEKIISEISNNYKFYYTIAYRYLRNHEDAQDVIQNVYELVVRKSPIIHSAKKLRCWIAVVCCRESLTMLRVKKRVSVSDSVLIRHNELISSYGNPEDIEFYYDDIVSAAIEMVPVVYQDALYDYYKNSTSLLYVAKKYNIPHTTLLHWKKKVQNKLKEFL